MNRLGCLALLLAMVFLELRAQTSDDDILLDNEQKVSGSSSPMTSSFSPERDRLLVQLKSEIEPNVLPADVQKIRRNISKLGSYNSKWSEEAADFLTTNSSLVELFLYDYSRVKDRRLNSKLLNVLLAFENYQYPLAPLYFSSDLIHNLESVAGLLPLMKKMISLHPDLFQSYWEWISEQELSDSQKIDFLRKSCESGAVFSLDLRSQIENTFQMNRSLWGDVFLSEVRRCMKGP